MYCRYSSDRQHESSIEAQELAIREWASRNDVKIVRAYYDRAFSATTDNRPDFLRMIADLRDAPVDLVLVHKQDRFARNRYDAAIYSREIQKRGSRLVCVAQDFGDSDAAVLLESLMQGLAEYYSKNLSSEVKKTRRLNIRAGRHAGGTYPFGYGPDGSGGYQIIELEAFYIRRLYECVLSGTPYAEVIHEMNAAGIRGRRGAAWKTSNISSMLRSPIYAGIYHAQVDDEVSEIPMHHPPIISPETYKEAMKIMDAKLNVGRKGRSSYLLQKLIRCQCGAPMHGHAQTRGDRVYRSYICDGHCGTRSVPCYEIEEAACKYVARLLSPELREQLVAALEEYIRGQRSAAAQRSKANARQIADLRAKIDATVENMSSGVLSPSVLERLSSQIASYEEQIRILEQVACPPPTISRAQIDDYFKDAAAVSPDDDFQTVQSTLRRFIQSITVYDDHFEFECTFNDYFNSLITPPDGPGGGSSSSVPRSSSSASSSASSGQTSAASARVTAEIRDAIVCKFDTPASRSTEFAYNKPLTVREYFRPYCIARQPLRRRDTCAELTKRI